MPIQVPHSSPRPSGIHRLKLLTACLGAILCLAWTLSQVVQVQERAAGILLLFDAPHSTSVRGQFDTGAGYESAPPVLMMLPASGRRTASLPLPPDRPIRSLRISIPNPDAAKLVEAQWFFNSPRRTIELPLTLLSDASIKNPGEVPGTRFQLDAPIPTRTSLSWQWHWQMLLGLAATLTMVACASWLALSDSGFTQHLVATLKPWVHGAFATWQRRSSVIAMAASILAAATIFVGLIRRPPFNDEGDNLVGATILAQGGTMYQDFYSQHPPFVYHLMSAFAALGVHTTEHYRLIWFSLLAASWVALFYIYRHDFGGEFMCVIVLGYAFTAVPYLSGYVLNDAPHAFGMLVIWLEFQRFRGISNMPYIRMLWVGCALFATIMSAAVSLYALFPLALAFLWQEFRTSQPYDPPARLRRGAAAVGILLAPLGALLTHYTTIGVLKKFYYQAYVFNRVIYSKYLNDYRGNPWVHFLKPPRDFVAYLASSAHRAIEGSLTPQESISVLFACGAILAIALVYVQRPFIAVCMMAFLIMAGDRGYTPTFHTQPFLVACLGILGVTSMKRFRDSTHKMQTLPAAGLLCVALLLVGQNTPAALRVARQSIESASATRYDDWIAHHTGPEDTIWESELTPELYLNTGRMPASRVIDLVPWFYQAYKEELLSDLANHRPKVIIMNPMQSVWGHYTHNYAPELIKFISTHYQYPPPETRPPSHLWVLKENDLARSD